MIVGADSLIKEVSESQFLALGELHNRIQLSRFTTALLDTAASFGFGYFAIETGPVAAEKLQKLTSEGIEQVSDFYDEYSNNLFNIYPIPFFTEKADLPMLKMANQKGYDFWGVDQEFSFSVPYLLDALADEAGELSPEQQKLLRKLHRSINWKQLRAQIFSGYDLACTLKDSEPLNTYLGSFNSGDAKVRMITDAIETSLSIYCMYEEGNYDQSNQTRIAYFKSNFDKGFNRASEQDSMPKVILKMGSYHSGRERSPLNYFDLGNHIQSLSDSLDTKALYLRFLNRYIDGEDMMDNENYSISANFMSVGEKDRWTLIDVRPIREQIQAKELTGSEFEIREIINYDYILIMPDDSKVDRHY
ncbi:MAG: hypothetical protein RLN90_03920 [Balneolaceae bacterium]